MSEKFKYAHSTESQLNQALQDCLAQLGVVPATANLGFVYVTDKFVEDMPEILARLKLATGVNHWVGSAGIGVCATDHEYLDSPAMVMMLGEFAEESFRIIDTISSEVEIPEAVKLGKESAYFGIVHGDPENQHIPELIEKFAAKMESGFVVGGITSSRKQHLQVADNITQGGLSGVAFSSAVAVSTRLTQGVSPLGQIHQITECERNIISTLDGRPALDVLREEIGEVLFKNPERLGNYIFAGLPIAGSDTGDYVVRNIVGMDLDDKLLAIGEYVQPGTSLMFCRRDGKSAVDDMQRMLDSLKSGLTAEPRGAVYYSCLGRGEGLFGPDSEELKIISRALGPIPLVGFFANGEISHNRLYGYTGVLTLFL
jgi:small ligand-binding sensory domain FIST